jgi:hypothetical protein
MRGADGYDGHGCTEHSCIPERRHYSKTGRIEEEVRSIKFVATKQAHMFHSE